MPLVFKLNDRFQRHYSQMQIDRAIWLHRLLFGFLIATVPNISHLVRLQCCVERSLVNKIILPPHYWWSYIPNFHVTVRGRSYKLSTWYSTSTLYLVMSYHIPPPPLIYRLSLG